MKPIRVLAVVVVLLAVAYFYWRQRQQQHYLVKTTERHSDGSWTDPVVHRDGTPFIGKTLVVAIRYPKDGADTLVHVYGPIVRLSERDGIVITRSDGRGEFAVPPGAFLVEEHQRETRPTSMTETIRPDYSTLIRLSGPPSEHGWDRQQGFRNE